MSLVRINKDPAPRDLRVFASLWLLFVGALGVVAWRQGLPLAAGAAWASALAVFAAGLAAPRLVRPVYLGAVYAAFPVGFVLSYVILGGVYFLVLAPVGLVMRLLGHDPLERRFEPAKKTYWKARDGAKSAHSYFRQS